MKNLIFLFLFIIVLSSGAQTISQVNKQLDSLNSLKKTIQFKIKDLQDQFNDIKVKTDALEAKKVSLANASNNKVAQDDVIVAKVMSGGAILRDAPSSTGKTLISIPGKETISVFKNQQNLYFKASYKGQIGYLSYSTIEQNQQIDDFLTEKEPVKQVVPPSVTTNRTVNESDPRFQKILKLYGRDKAVKIMNRELWQGMSYGMVLESIGKPNSKSSVNSNEGMKEQWIYSDYNLDFINGELKNWTKK